jgi:hypothetical protein
MAALPGTQNSYVYSLNNPVRYTDPSGKLVPLLLLGALIGGGFGAFSYWQTQPCSTFSSLLNDPGFWQAALIGAGAGMAAGLVGAGVAAFGVGAFGGSIWGAVITGAVGGGLAGGVGEGVAQLLTYGNIRNPQLVGVAMLSGVGFGGAAGAIGYSIGQSLSAPRPANSQALSPSRPVNSQGVSYPTVNVSGYGQVPFPEGPITVTDPNPMRAQYTTELRTAFRQQWHSNYGWYPPPDVYEIHHILPLSRGGTNEFTNLVPLPPSEHLQFTNWWLHYP